MFCGIFSSLFSIFCQLFFILIELNLKAYVEGKFFRGPNSWGMDSFFSKTVDVQNHYFCVCSEIMYRYKENVKCPPLH